MIQFPFPQSLADDLRRVEQVIQERTKRRAAVINAVQPRQSMDQEPIRAALVLIAALTGEYQVDRLLHAAAAVELIHSATSAHLVLVDEAARRRGTTQAGEWGQGLPLMVGDYLFALAAGEMALTPDARVIDYYSQAVMQITEAALAPPPPLRPLEPGRARHIERLSGSTALVAAACKAGGTCAGVATEELEVLARYGQCLGLALALANEVRALQPGAEPTPIETLRSGALSLPLVFAAHLGDGERLAAALDSSDENELAWAAAEVARHGFAPTQGEVARQVSRAREALAGLEPGEGRDALHAAAAYPLELTP